MSLVLSVVLVFLVIYTIPILVYGMVSVLTGLQPPGKSPARFLSGVAVSKLGTAIAFVFFWHLSSGLGSGNWLLYASLWAMMLVFGEIGQVISGETSLTEAGAGILSEILYFPLAGWVMVWALSL